MEMPYLFCPLLYLSLVLLGPGGELFGHRGSGLQGPGLSWSEVAEDYAVSP